MPAQNQRKLSDDIVREICDLITDGMSLANARVHIEQHHGISISKASLHSYHEVQHAIKARAINEKMQTAERLQTNKPKVIDGLITRMSQIIEETTKIHGIQKSLNPGDKEYTRLGKDLRTLDMSYKDFLKQYVAIAADSAVTTGRFENTKTTPEERNDFIESLIADAEARLDIN